MADQTLCVQVVAMVFTTDDVLRPVNFPYLCLHSVQSNVLTCLLCLHLFSQPSDVDMVDRFISCTRQATPFFVVSGTECHMSDACLCSMSVFQKYISFLVALAMFCIPFLLSCLPVFHFIPFFFFFLFIVHVLLCFLSLFLQWLLSCRKVPLQRLSSII